MKKDQSFKNYPFGEPYHFCSSCKYFNTTFDYQGDYTFCKEVKLQFKNDNPKFYDGYDPTEEDYKLWCEHNVYTWPDEIVRERFGEDYVV